MKIIPSYTKILTLGATYTENALVGEVIVQEKVDGSQFSFGVNENKELVFRSKSVSIHSENCPRMFQSAVNYLLTIQDIILNFPIDTYFYCEILEKPKHNVLKYERIPKNHIIVFDAMKNLKWLNREELTEISELFNIELIPELWRGNIKKLNISSVDFIKNLLENTMSILGNEKIEGIVIKNYEQTILLGGHIFPLFTKYVREQFKERHNIEWKTKHPKDSLVEYINSFCNENRWNKALLYLKERGEIENQPRDIGKLIRRVQEDIIEEETENIKTYLFKKFKDDILRKSIKALPEWYKEKLLSNIKGN